MFIQTTEAGSTPAGKYIAGAILEIPREYYDPAKMLRLGTWLTPAQRTALVLWSTVCPDWHSPINGE